MDILSKYRLIYLEVYLVGRLYGLPDLSVKESKERVKTAIRNSGFELRSRRIIINLAPVDTKKEGPIFDLPIAISILINLGYINKSNNDNIDFSDTIFLGALSLNGDVTSVNGILPMCIEAKKINIKKVVLPYENVKEASIVSDIEIIGIKNLREVVDYLNNNISLDNQNMDFLQVFRENSKYKEDFSDVKGQENAKRALEIAAAGGHNCILIGSPGSGKTMLAKRLPSILPNLSFEEALEITKIHSIAGILSKDVPIITKRPFRAPHHTISPNALIGGGKNPKPGEISLAHYGVLFLDELLEFNKNTLEVLRGPLEDGIVTISRVSAKYSYPSTFMFIASMNPCPCGYYGNKDKQCTCSQNAISKYINKISGPLLDRIDIQIEVNPVNYNKLEKNDKIEDSNIIRERVNKAREIQRKRYKQDGIYSNSELSPKLVEKYCKLDSKGKKILKMAFENLGLSARAYSRILKVSRTIADLEQEEHIKQKHIAEAIQYRSLDKKYWKN